MANLISLLRVILAFVVMAILIQPHTATHLWWCFGLTVIVIWMDGLDGYVARKLNESSKAGAVIDILSDRVVELTYWIGFLAFGWVDLWVPLLVCTRGIVVDGLRSLALEQGYTAFGSSSVMQHPLGVLLVSSRFSRWGYAVCKAVAFSVTILAHLPQTILEQSSLLMMLPSIAYWSIMVTLFFCVVRGLPVLFECQRFLTPERTPSSCK